MAKDYFCVEEIILIHYLAAQEDCLTNRGEKRESSFIVHKYVSVISLAKMQHLHFIRKDSYAERPRILSTGLDFIYFYFLSTAY